MLTKDLHPSIDAHLLALHCCKKTRGKVEMMILCITLKQKCDLEISRLTHLNIFDL